MAKINPFAELNVTDMSVLLEKYDVQTDPKQLSAIKEKAFKEAGLEKEKKRTKVHFFRIAVSAAAVGIVLLAAVITLIFASDKPQTQLPQTSASEPSQGIDTNSLMTAISRGDDSLVGSLLDNGVLVNEDVLSYAMKNVKRLSFGSIRDLAKAVKEKFGTTGLDPLLENAVLGNSEEVITLLNNKETLTSLSDRLAYFFSAAFCSSDTLKLFNEKGIDIRTTDENGDTVYEIAKKYGNEDNERYALDTGAEK